MADISASKINYFTNVALRNVPNTERFKKFGNTAQLNTGDVGTGLPVWPLTIGIVWPPLNSQLTIFSSSVEDNPAGSGASKIRIHGIHEEADGTWIWMDEDITLDGQNPVVTVNTYLRVNRAAVIELGTTGTFSNVGTITLDHADGTIAVIPITSSGLGFGRTNQMTLSVPSYWAAIAGTGEVGLFRSGGASDRDATVISISRQNVTGVTNPPWFITTTRSVTQNAISAADLFPASLPAKVDAALYVTAVSSNATAVYANFDGAFLRNWKHVGKEGWITSPV